MSSPNVNAGLVPKRSLVDLAKAVKEANPGVKDDDDVRVVAMFLKKFPDQVKWLTPQDSKVAQEFIDEGGEPSIRAFYGAFGKTPMKDVSLDEAPDFVKPVLHKQGTRMVSGHEGGSSVAHVNPSDPHHIYVDEPIMMDKPTMAHETVHVFQGSLKEPMKGDPQEQAGGHDANYDYGGWKGLIEAQGKHKSIRDFTDEQQAEMVGDYVRLQDSLHDPAYVNKTPEFKKQLLEEWDLANKALAPYLRQLSGQPKEGDPQGNLLHLGTIDTRPAPLGPPPAALTGIASPLSQIGGHAAFISLKSGLVPKEKSESQKKSKQVVGVGQ